MIRHYNQHHQKYNFAQDLHQNHHQNHPGHLHGLKDVIVSHPGPRLASPLLARLGPDLVEAGNDERAPAIKQLVKSGQSGQKWLRVALIRLKVAQSSQNGITSADIDFITEVSSSFSRVTSPLGESV